LWLFLKGYDAKHGMEADSPSQPLLQSPGGNPKVLTLCSHSLSPGSLCGLRTPNFLPRSLRPRKKHPPPLTIFSIGKASTSWTPLHPSLLGPVISCALPQPPKKGLQMGSCLFWCLPTQEEEIRRTAVSSQPWGK
jgi:hypothetical protein